MQSKTFKIHAMNQREAVHLAEQQMDLRVTVEHVVCIDKPGKGCYGLYEIKLEESK